MTMVTYRVIDCVGIFRDYNQERRLCVSNGTDLKQEMEREIKKRIEITESPSYDVGPPLNRRDLMGALVVGVICVFGLLWGIY